MRITEIARTGPVAVRTGRDGALVLRLPIVVKRRSAHKRIIGGNIATTEPVAPVVLTPFQFALVRAHRWLALLESGAATSLQDIAQSERVDPSLVSRLLNLTTHRECSPLAGSAGLERRGDLSAVGGCGRADSGGG